MKIGTAAATAMMAILLSACVPAGDNFQPGPGPGPGTAVGPGSQSPVATSREIVQYVSNGSAFIEYFEGSVHPGSYECGYFDANGYYESAWANSQYLILDDFVGSWSVRGSELCFQGSWFDGSAHFGCNLAEWSLDDTMLLIDRSDRVVAEITTFDGPGEYSDFCGFG